MPRIDGYSAPTSSANSFGGAIMGGGPAVSSGPRSAGTTIRSAPKATVSGKYRAQAVNRKVGSAPSSPPTTGPGPVPDINSFLGGDSGYQDQLKQFANALALFNADIGRRKGTLETDYASSQKAMNDQKLIDLDNLEADYGARGILRSGLYGKAVGDYNTEFNTRMTDLGNKQKDALAGLDQETARYKSQQDLQTQAAREAAIRRRAEQYGI